MLREIYIDKFNKIVSSFKPDLFNCLTISQAKPYNKDVQLYQVYDQRQQIYNLYIFRESLEPILNQIPFIEASPKFLLFSTDKDHIILQERIQENLYDYLLKTQDYAHYVSLGDQRENLAKKVLWGIKRSLSNYSENNIDYNAINPKNIVRKKFEWQLSLVGLLLKNQKQSEDYYKKGVEKDHRNSYALGTLLFKLLFGFVPFEKKKEFVKFSFKDFPNYLDREENKKFLKVYAFADGLLDVSRPAKELIEMSLEGRMSTEDFFNNRFFEQGSVLRGKKEINPATREIKMLSMFEQVNQSLIMAAIEHRRKFSQERLNAKLIFSLELTKQETIQYFKKHPILFEIEFDMHFREEKDKGKVKQTEESLPTLNIPYYYREDEFDCELDLPCRQLLKLIDNTINQKDLSGEEARECQAKIKLYAYPYTVAFQLAKVSQSQPFELQRKIQRLSEELLQISQLNYYPQVQPLHETSLAIKSFDDIKIKLRELLNEVYKHFLNEAIKKYNVKKELMTAAERTNSKAQGLQYYKLCLKLMECSILNRKKGHDLDLQRIETSTRKEVEADLNQLLKQYFPTKIEHF